MNIPKKLQGQIRRKKKEIQQLESERNELDTKIRDGNTYLSALEDTLNLYPKEEVDENPAQSLRAGKSVAKIYEILKQSGSPMHITDILVAMGKETDKRSQQATGSQLNNYVRKDRIFSRPLGNTFGLKEWGNTDGTPPLSATVDSVQAGLPLAEEG